MTRFHPIALLLPLPSLLPAQNWQLRQPTTTPPAAIQPRMAFDQARGRAILFGGWLGNGVHDDTWEWNGTNWTLTAPALRPPERDDHSLAFDALRGRTVLFGGEDLAFALITDTWEWNGANWAQVPTAHHPVGRLGAPMCFDSARNVCVLFGGTDWAFDYGDTWEYDGVDWTQRATAVFPTPRGHAAMAYHAGRQRSVLFGGDANGVLLDDTWEWNGTAWTRVVTDGAPQARVDHTMAYDPARQRIVLFGGADDLIDRDDTWEYDGSRWFQVTTVARPAGRSGGAGTFDPVRGEALVFGGFSNGASADLWAFGGNTATYRTHGTGCPGSNSLPPRLVPTAVPALGGAIDLDLLDLPASPGAVILAIGLGDTQWGANALPLDLTAWGMPGCRAYTSGEANAVIGHNGGSVHFSFPLPVSAAFAGLRLHHQIASLDPTANPTGLATSNAGEATLR